MIPVQQQAPQQQKGNRSATRHYVKFYDVDHADMVPEMRCPGKLGMAKGDPTTGQGDTSISRVIWVHRWAYR